jgi:hypothetical protein
MRAQQSVLHRLPPDLSTKIVDDLRVRPTVFYAFYIKWLNASQLRSKRG